MAVLWLRLGGRGDVPGLVDILVSYGLEVRTWTAGAAEPPPEDLRGFEGLVVVGGAGRRPDAHVRNLLEDAREAELPVLVLGSDVIPASRTVWLGESPGTRPGPSPEPSPEPEAQPDASVHTPQDAPAAPHALYTRFAERVATGRERALTRAFFTPKAASWEKRFPDDLPVYRAAVAELGLRRGQAALDVGCGTGRALPLLRESVGPDGTVIGTDVTPAMLREASRAGRREAGELVIADAVRLPLRDAVLHGVFAAGLLHHVDEPLVALREFARVTRPGGRLVLFHPVGRAVLAERHGRTLRPDDLQAEPQLRRAFAAAGWRLIRYEDREERFLVVGVL